MTRARGDFSSDCRSQSTWFISHKLLRLVGGRLAISCQPPARHKCSTTLNSNWFLVRLLRALVLTLAPYEVPTRVTPVTSLLQRVAVKVLSTTVSCARPCWTIGFFLLIQVVSAEAAISIGRRSRCELRRMQFAVRIFAVPNRAQWSSFRAHCRTL